MKEWLKENMIYVIVVILLLFFSGMAIYKNLAQPAYTGNTRNEQTSPSSSDSSATSEVETADEKNYRKAKLMLEYPYTESSEEQNQQVLNALDEAINNIKNAGHLSEVQGTLENHLTMSHDAMIQTFAMAILVNQYSYQPSQLEVTKSESDDVVQFLIVLSKEGEENCYFVGNFNTTVHQIQLKAYVGGNIGGTFG